jgi:predicted amidophosphoribosyltransferase
MTGTITTADAHTLTDRNRARWAIYPLAWCPKCEADRPHAGPYCQVCGTSNDYRDLP